MVTATISKGGVRHASPAEAWKAPALTIDGWPVHPHPPDSEVLEFKNDRGDELLGKHILCWGDDGSVSQGWRIGKIVQRNLDSRPVSGPKIDDKFVTFYVQYYDHEGSLAGHVLEWEKYATGELNSWALLDERFSVAAKLQQELLQLDAVMQGIEAKIHPYRSRVTAEECDLDACTLRHVNDLITSKLNVIYQIERKQCQYARFLSSLEK